MYLSEICDVIGETVNDTTLKSAGTNYGRTKQWVREFYNLDLATRRNWNFAKKEGTITTTAGTQRYNLARWVDNSSKLIQLIDTTNGYNKITYSTPQDINGKYDLTNYAAPSQYVLGPRIRTVYSTGTITGTSGAKVITGASTAWLSSGIEQFDRIRAGSYVYTVDTVDSDTQITLFEDIITTIAGGTAYNGIKDRWTIDLYSIPNATLTLNYISYQVFPRLDDDADEPILPDNWHHILVKAGIVKALQHNDDPFEVELQELEMFVKRLISEDAKETDNLEYIGIPRSRSY